jgi:pyridoxamine 5'-phosphate oxidase
MSLRRRRSTERHPSGSSCKGIDERLVFFTDARSRKGRELRDNPRASLALYWQPKGRQVRVKGRMEEITPAEADAY